MNKQLKFLLIASILLISIHAVQAGCPVVPGGPVGHTGGSSANRLNGYVAFAGGNGTGATWWFISQATAGRTFFTFSDATCSTLPAFFPSACTGVANTAWFIDDWGNPGIPDGCPLIRDPALGCGTSGDVTGFIFETVSNSGAANHATVYVGASADWNSATGEFDLDCRGALTQAAIPVPLLDNASTQATLLWNIPATAINIAAGSPGLAGLGYQLYRTNALTPTVGTDCGANLTFPTNAGPWTAVGAVTAAGGQVSVSGLGSGCYLFTLKPVFTDSMTTTNFGANSTVVGIGPLAVTGVVFNGTQHRNGQVDLAWSTKSEQNTAGFNLYRSLGSGPFVKVNTGMVAAKGQGGAGATYSYTDRVSPKAARAGMAYRLEEVETSGATSIVAQTTLGMPVHP